MQTRKSAFITLVALLSLALNAFADMRKENIDVILAIDKSLSMSENGKIEIVKSYINTWLMNDVLIQGDHLVVIDFYGKADVIVSQTIDRDADKQNVEGIINQIRANGSFTDIGNALDVMEAEIQKLTNDGRKKFVLLMTDGRQEAPPTSKYYSASGTFNHELLANTKTIQKEGWKIQILGIGTETAVKELAQELSGSYTEVTANPSVETLKKETENLLGTISLVNGLRASPVGFSGKSGLSLTLKSEGYSRAVAISISAIQATLPARTIVNILPAPLDVNVGASGNTEVRIGVRFPTDLPAGTTSCTVAFTFLSGERFNPSEVQTTLVVRGFLANYWWIGLAGLLVLAVITFIAVLLIRRMREGKPLHLVLSLDGVPLEHPPFILHKGHEAFLTEAGGSVVLISKKNPKSIGRLRVNEAALSLDVLKAERFPRVSGSLSNAVDHVIVLRFEDGRNRDLRISAAGNVKSQPPAPDKAEAAGKPAVTREGPKRGEKNRPRSRGTGKKPKPRETKSGA